MNTGAPDTSGASLLAPGSARDVESPRLPPSEEPLITEGRAAKLELLLYLIANLKSHLILSGPEGIGKSRVLRQVEGHSKFGWTVCFMEGDLGDLAQIKHRLSAVAGGAIGIDPKLGLERCLEAFEAKNRQVVALIDDAATSPGGILDALYHLADKHRALRLVLAMTRDELDGRMQVDAMLAKFHIIEIPPLNDKQCREFFHRIAASHSPSEPISKALAAKIFRSTEGIPGRVIATLPRIDELTAQDRKSRQLMTYGGIGVGVIMACVLFTLLNALSGKDEREENRPRLASSQTSKFVDKQTARGRLAESVDSDGEGNRTEVVADKPEYNSTPRKDAGFSKSVPDQDGKYGLAGDVPLGSSDSKQIANQSTERLTNQREIGNNPIRSGAELELSNNTKSESLKSVEVADQSVLENSRKSDLTGQGDQRLDNRTDAGANRKKDGNPLRNKKMPATAEIGSVSSKFAAAGMEGDAWLLAKNPNDYTLQIMAAQKPDPLITFATQHPELRDLAYFRTWKNGSEWLAIVYGSFASLADASRAAKNLPASLGKPWPRTFKAIHQKIHSLRRN